MAGLSGIIRCHECYGLNHVDARFCEICGLEQKSRMIAEQRKGVTFVKLFEAKESATPAEWKEKMTYCTPEEILSIVAWSKSFYKLPKGAKKVATYNVSVQSRKLQFIKVHTQLSVCKFCLR